MTRTSESATVTTFPESSICEMETLIREPTSKISVSAAAGQYNLPTASILEDPVALETEDIDDTGVVSDMKHGPLQVVGIAGACQTVALCISGAWRPVALCFAGACRPVALCVAGACRPVALCIAGACRPVALCIAGACRPVALSIAG
jgi:hypothetical protein